MSATIEIPKRSWTAARAAERIGIHRATLIRRCDQGEGPPHIVLPGIRRTIRFLPEDVERWLREHREG